MKPAFSLLFIYITALALTGFGDPAYFANKRGVEKYNEKKYEDALKEYLKAQKGDPDEKSIDYNLGGAYYKMGRYGEAVRAYARALSSKNDNIKKSARFNLGAALYKAGDMAASSGKTGEAQKSYKESARQYKSLLNKDSSDDDARHNLELALLKIKEMERKKKQEQKQQKKDQKKKEGNSGKKKQDKSGHEKNNENKPGRENKKEDKKNKKNEKTPQQNAKNKDGSKNQNEQKQNNHTEARQITKKQAERIFDAIERDEKILKEKILKGQLKKLPELGKDW